MRERALVAGPWHGSRSYDSTRDQPRPMDLVLERDGSAVDGSGSDQDGAFSLKGTVSDSGEVRLAKQYASPERVIELVGDLDRRTGKVSGLWRIEGRRHGSFEIAPGKRPAPRKARALPPPVALPEDVGRVEVLVARALAEGELPFVLDAYVKAFAELKAFAERNAFVPVSGVDAPMNALRDAQERLARTLVGPMPPARQAQAREQAGEIVAEAERVAKVLEQTAPARLTLDASARGELAQLFATWLAELRREAARRRNAVYVTVKLADLLASVDAELGAAR